MICVAISDKSLGKCLATLDEVEMAEIRLDLTDFNAEEIKKVFSYSKTTLTIATCRPDKVGSEVQLEKLKTAIIAGAGYVDIEIEAQENQREELIDLAHKWKRKVIISYHNFEKTPGLKELYAIADTCYSMGADMAKITTMINSDTDNARILSLYSLNKPMVALGMGHKGKLTRIIAPMLGAEFTFASMDNGEATAPGQIKYKKMKKIIALIEKELKKEG